MLKIKPFVKWVGGKRQILDKLKKYIPQDYNTYYEPFIGGGALFFDIMPMHRAIINDSNEELMNVYNCIKDANKYKKLCSELDKHEKLHSEAHFYEVRNLDRDKSKFKRLADYKRAARTIYLNKACFNGLYRVNSKNEFNAPSGKKETVHTYDAQNLSLIHSYLNFNNTIIQCIDFEESVKTAKAKDLIYLDPPYDSDTNTFNSYTEKGFTKEDQKRLAKVFKELSDKGCYVILSNHNTKLVQQLYKDYNIHKITARRVINADGTKRGKVEEVIITNF